MDERIDMSRSVSDGRCVYIRNYFPHRPQGQYLEYMFQTPTTRVWKQLFDAGELNAVQSRFWQPKECEELYDLQSDRDETTNLAGSSEHRAKLDELRTALVDQTAAIWDTGFIPEEIRNRLAGSGSIYDFVREDDFYAAQVWHSVAVHATDPTSPERNYFADADAYLPLQDVALYWAATGALSRGECGVQKFQAELRSVLDGEPFHHASATTQIVAAEALGKFGDESDLDASLDLLIEVADIQMHGVYIAQAALIAIDELDDRAAPLRDRIAKLPTEAPGVNSRMNTYVPRLIEKTLADLAPSKN
jgi:uncharacterized sulfatase